MTGVDAGSLQHLVAGFARFRSRHYRANPGGDALIDGDFLDLVQEGQRPHTLIIACSDSRVDPALLLDAAPGQLFVIRNVANLVPPFERSDGQHGVSAAIEYAITVLQVRHAIVMGHSHCGGIQTLVQSPERCDDGACTLLGRWMSLARPAYQQARARLPQADSAMLAHECEQGSILASLRNLESFPSVQTRLAAGELSLHGWYFDMQLGQLLGFAPQHGQFQPLGRIDTTES